MDGLDTDFWESNCTDCTDGLDTDFRESNYTDYTDWLVQIFCDGRKQVLVYFRVQKVVDL